MASRDERLFLFDDPEVMTDALTRSVQEALKQHKQARNYVAAWREGKIVRIAPDAILLLEDVFTRPVAIEETDENQG